MTFQNSEIYKKALQEYRDKTYSHLLNPDNVIIEEDNVYLFYKVDGDTINSYLAELVHFSKSDENSGEDSFSKHLGYETPRKIKYKFMGVEYQAIHLWYDGERGFAHKRLKNQ